MLEEKRKNSQPSFYGRTDTYICIYINILKICLWKLDIYLETGNWFTLFIQQVFPRGPLPDSKSQALGIQKTASPALRPHLLEEKLTYEQGFVSLGFEFASPFKLSDVTLLCV